MDSLQKALFGTLSQCCKLLAGGLVLCSPTVPLKGFEVITLLPLQSKAISNLHRNMVDRWFRTYSVE